MKATSRMRLLALIFWSFFKIGPVTFGGGYAMIPLFQKEMVERRRWLDEEEVTDVFAIAQSTPGAVAVNSATFVGYKVAGVGGALAALAGVLLPTFLIVIAMCVAFLQLKNNPKANAAFQGIRPAVVALIVYAALRIGRSAVKDRTTAVVFLASFVLLILSGMNPVYVILLGLLAGLVLVKVQIRFFGRKPDHEDDEHVFEDYFMGDGI